MADISPKPFWQEIARVGTYRLKDGRVLGIKPADAANMVEQGNGMLKAGLRVPFAWQHPPAAMPSYNLSHPTEWIAKGYFGEPKEFKLAGDRVLGLMKIPATEDHKQFAKVKTVSPRIMENWIDEKGKTWPGLTISHVGATPMPVAREQQHAELSRAGEPPAGCFDLSDAEYAEEKPEDGPTESKPSPSTPDTSSASSKPLQGIGRFVQVLEKLNIKLGQGVTDEDDLYSRLVAIAANMGGDENPDPDAMTEEVTDDDLTPASSGMGPMLMSQLPDNVKKKLAGVVERERKQMLLETNGFVKKRMIEPSVASAHKAAIKAADLSLADSGELELIPIVVRHKTFLDLIPGRAFSLNGRGADMSNLEEVDSAHGLDALEGPEAEAAANKAALEFAFQCAGVK